VKIRLLPALCCSAVLFAATAGHAEDKINMAKVTCAQIASEGNDAMTNTLFWLDGYISKEKGDAVLTESWMKELGEMVVEACKTEPNKPLLELVRQAMR
jgi:hypothetical protein